MMHWSFYIMAGVTVGSAIAAMSLRNIVHCALLLTITFSGLAVLYLQLNAQFVAFAQILVYVGAVAILVVFAILLTRGSERPPDALQAKRGLGWGLLVALGAFAVIIKAILSSRLLSPNAGTVPSAPVKLIGRQLMENYVLPLEIVALLLTAALVGAAVIALQERRRVE
jgi:NADH-quinone oxidoreductase subunit J